MKTIEIEVKEFNNSNLWVASSECSKQNINAMEVETILVWCGNTMKRMEFAFDVDGKIMGLQKKWD